MNFDGTLDPKYPIERLGFLGLHPFLCLSQQGADLTARGIGLPAAPQQDALQALFKQPSQGLETRSEEAVS